MKTKNLLLIAIAILSLAGCKYNDEAIWDAIRKQEERITALETWQKQASDEIAILKAITDESDYILSIVPVMEGGTQKGYTITFKKYGTITLLNSQKGISLISLKQEEDGNWYWTLNGSLVTDANGEPIRANGNPVTPQLKTGRQLTEASIAGTWQDDALYLSVDNGKTWSKVPGDKGDTNTGSSIEIIDNTNFGYVIFEVSGQKITVPRYNAALSLVITDPDGQTVEDEYIRSIAYGQTATFTYSGLNSGSTIVVIAPTGWLATLDRANSHINITSPSVSDCSSHPEWAGPVETIILVSDGSGMNALPIRTIASDYFYCNADNLIAMLGKRPDVEKLKVSGTLTSDHMDKIKELNSLKEIDLEDATLEGNAIPDGQFSDNKILTTVKLPESLTEVGNNAFSSCKALSTVNLPERLVNIGDAAFSNCSGLSDIKIGNKVNALPLSVFAECSSLKNINVPASVESLGWGAFYNCSGLETITIEEGKLRSLDANVFYGCSRIEEITLPSTLTNIGGSVFLNCTALKKLQCKAANPPTFTYDGYNPNPLGANLPTDFKITVPSGSVDKYKKAAGWEKYKNKIEAIQ
ncbi:leucine-rich repeat protein [Parabacteroides sp. APC149_11_2_Y6]